MKVTLHTQNKEIKDNKIIKVEGEFVSDLDFSLASQIRYEAKFPELAQREDLFNYSKRICAIKDSSVAVILSKMKMLYCWFDTDITFIDFIKLFDLTDKEYVEKLTNEMSTIFELIFNSSAEKN